MTNTVLSVQLPGRDGRYERFLRCEVEGAHVEDLRKAVTRMMKKPSDFEIGERYGVFHKRGGKRPKPVYDPKLDAEVPGVERTDEATA